MKSELEDLSFRYLEPDRFKELTRRPRIDDVLRAEASLIEL
jgi:(p)ppGpp synthase/HD superfamily hydrolase